MATDDDDGDGGGDPIAETLNLTDVCSCMDVCVYVCVKYVCIVGVSSLRFGLTTPRHGLNDAHSRNRARAPTTMLHRRLEEGREA